MRAVAAVGRTQVPVVLVGLAVAVQDKLTLWDRLAVERLTQAVAVVAHLVAFHQVQVDQVLLLFPTLAHNVVLAAQLHQAVATLFTHLHLVVHSQLN
jgi:hypothetical protein